jgi:hypothetical protein
MVWKDGWSMSGWFCISLWIMFIIFLLLHSFFSLLDPFPTLSWQHFPRQLSITILGSTIGVQQLGAQCDKYHTLDALI